MHLTINYADYHRPSFRGQDYLEPLPPTENLDPVDKDEQAKEGEGTEASYQGSESHGGRPEEEKYDADQNFLETSDLHDQEEKLN